MCVCGSCFRMLAVKPLKKKKNFFAVFVLLFYLLAQDSRDKMYSRGKTVGDLLHNSSQSSCNTFIINRMPTAESKQCPYCQKGMDFIELILSFLSEGIVSYNLRKQQLGITGLVIWIAKMCINKYNYFSTVYTLISFTYFLKGTFF